MDAGGMAARDADEGVLARAIAGSKPGEAVQAEAALYQRLFPRARLYGLRHLKDRSAAEDLAQEVLLHAIESLRARRVREPDRIASFVLGSCRMRVQDTKKVASRRERILERLGPAPSSEQAEPTLRIEDRRLTECLEHLSPRLKTLVALTFYAEAESDQIARELGTTPGNVRVMRHRAIGQLKSCLEEKAP